MNRLEQNTGRVLRNGLLATTTIIIFVGFVTSATAQVFPIRTDLQKVGLKGDVRQVTEHARSWSASLDRWNPLVVTTMRTFTKEGMLRREVVIYRNEPVDQKMFRYDSATGTARPIAETNAAGGDGSEVGQLVRESGYIYDEDGRLRTMILRDYRGKQTSVVLHQYDTKNRLKNRITTDSADGYIRRIESFYWLADDRPAGSVIRTFNPETDPFRSLKDTAGVPESRILRDYTSYAYDQPETPVIYWHWEFNGDSTIDRQTVRRFGTNEKLYATITQKFTDTTVTESRTQLYNPDGDIFSTADIMGGRTMERAFDYIYDPRDDAGNWIMRRQYVALDPKAPTSSERVLVSRTDRTILYY